MKRTITSLLLILITCINVKAQFSDSVRNFVNFTGTGTFNRTGDGVTYLLNNGLKYSVRQKSFVMNSTSLWVYGNTPEKLTNNDFTTALDFNLYKTFPHFYYWGLVNFTSSFSLKINQQMQTGLGIAYRFIDKERTMLSVSNGILFERSSIVNEISDNFEYQTFRNSLRVQYRTKIKEIITFNGSAFYQPSLSYFSDYIITANATLGFKIWKWLSLTTTCNFNKVTRTNRENVIFTYGLVFERYF